TNSAGADLGTNYSATNFATFQLAFSMPTSADLAAVPNATAHIMAKVFQADTSGTPVQVSSTIELVTSLPLPAASDHRFGYFAVWGSVSFSGDVIGYFDNLTAQGAVGLPPNVPPAVGITGPANGASFTEPATIIIAADATDSDGTIARVDFLAGATLLGTVTNS